MPIYSETMSGGLFGSGNAVFYVASNPLHLAKAGLSLPISQTEFHPNQSRVNRFSVQANGLRHWWRFDHPEGFIVYDLLDGYNGEIISNDPDLSWAYDVQKKSWVWDNSDENYVELSPTTSGFVGGCTSFTITAWIKMDDIDSDRPIISRDVTAGSNFFSLGWEPGSGFAARFNFINTNGRTGEIIDVTTGIWTHVVFVYNGLATGTNVNNTNSKRLKIYVNGVERPLEYNGSVPSSIATGEESFFIGRSADQFFKGRIDDVRFYNRNLTSNEISNIYYDPSNISLLSLPVVLAVLGDPDTASLVSAGSAAVSSQMDSQQQGGARSGGIASAMVSYFSAIAAGVVASGVATNISSYVPTGSILASGTSVSYVDFNLQGGVSIAGVSGVTSVVNEPVFSEIIYGLIAYGRVNISQSKVYRISSTGLVSVEGSALCGISGARYHSSGGIVLSSNSTASIVFNKHFTFLWRVNRKVERQYTFLWNVGQLQMFWYRVVSKGVYGTGCPLIGDPCCQKFIVNIHARSLSELCGKLSNRKYKFPIDTVHRFSKPAENSVVAVDETSGIDHTCQTLIPVEVCGIPACADFCVDNDLKQKIKFVSFVQMNAFLDYEGGGNVYTGGTSATRLVKNLPSYSCVAEGSIVVGGSGTSSPNHFASRGGLLCIDNGSFVESSRYYYVGGVYPNTSNLLYGSVNINKKNDDGEQLWSLPDRVNADDGLCSQVDVSFGKKSQQLIVTGFGMTIPSWARVMGIKLRVSRFATQTAIRDVDVYLIRNGRQISDNLADLSNDWPLIETEKVYGSNGIDNKMSFVSPDSDRFSSDLTFEDLNDQSFGVLVKIRSRQSLVAQIAKINYIKLEAFYELPNGSIIRMGGESRVLFRDYNYSSVGKTIVSSLSSFKVGHKFNSKGLGSNALGEIEPTGHAAIRYDESMAGGATVNGLPKITPYFESMAGGATVNGGSERKYRLHYIGDGTITLNSNSFVPEVQYKYIASGGIVLASNNRVRTNAWKWISDGNAVFIFGSADQKASSIGTPVQLMKFGMRVIQTTAIFSGDVQANNIGVLTGRIQKCTCTDMDLRLQLTHNIARDNVLSSFLARNGYDIPTVIRMRYNSTNDSWQCNLHYRGMSPDGSSLESWNIVFELQCTSLIGGIEIGSQIWKLAIYANRKNLMSRDSFESRVIIAILPDPICAVQGAEIDFNVEYDTKADLAVVRPLATIYQNTLYDNIGLFKNYSWSDDPRLKLRISQASREKPVSRINLTKTVPASANV